MTTLEQELTDAINRASAESNSNTPDYILGRFLSDCLDAYGGALRATKSLEAKPYRSTTVPGLKSHHRIITPDCRAAKTDADVIDEALATAHAYLERAMNDPACETFTWHVVVTVEYGSQDDKD